VNTQLVDQNLGRSPRIVLTAHQSSRVTRFQYARQKLTSSQRGYRFTLSAATDQGQ
jgi:hypothetical protein